MITMWYLQSHRTWDRFCHSSIGSPSSPLGPSRRTSLCRWQRRCTPDRSKLFGSHGQRPWLHNVVTLADHLGVVRVGTPNLPKILLVEPGAVLGAAPVLP